MTSEKIKDIKHGLECLMGKTACNLCPYDAMAEDSLCTCVNLVSEDALELITEYESRIAELSKEAQGCVKKEIAEFQNGYIIGKRKGAITLADMLKDYIHRCENISNSTDEDLCDQIDEILKQIMEVQND